MFSGEQRIVSYIEEARCLKVKSGGTCVIAIHGAISGSLRCCEAVGMVRSLGEIDCVTALHN